MLPTRFRRARRHLWLPIAIGWAGLAIGAPAPPERLWIQERVTVGSDGLPLTPLHVRAEHLTGLVGHSFRIGHGATLEIRTDLPDPEAQGLAELAAAVTRAHAFASERIGLSPRGDILLYLIEVEEMPAAYRFEAVGALDSRYGEVRLAWIPRGAALWGEEMPEDLAELVLDTLPHELVHDQLNQLPRLAQDVGDRPSVGTRWFVEGTCELVAKEFCREESPDTWARLVRMRRLDRAEELLEARATWTTWSQAGKRPQLESDLYGVSWLLMRLWSQRVDPRALVGQLRHAAQTVEGAQLLDGLEQHLQVELSELLPLAAAEAEQILAEVAEVEGGVSAADLLPAR